mgnify:CR=1 FL=1
MSDDPNTVSPSTAGIPPVLRDIVAPGQDQPIPVLDPSQAVSESLPFLSAEAVAELADILQLSLTRELNYAIDGAVYERLQAAMEEMASSVKRNLHQHLEQLLPDLVQAALQQQLKQKDH